MIFPTLQSGSGRDLGSLLLHWYYEPPKKRRTLQRLLWLAALIALILLALSPLTDGFGGRIGGAIGYALIVLFSSLLPRLWRTQQPRFYELRDRGVVVYAAGGSEKGVARIAFWSDFADVVRQENGVRLIPRNPLQRTVYLPTGSRRFDVYFVCREKVWQAKFERRMQRWSRSAVR